jgi:nitrite reductase (NO-forming)
LGPWSIGGDSSTTLTYTFTADHSGAWLHHCATTPMSLHIANGMFGSVIIDPPGLGAASQEFVFIRSELYLGPPDGIADSTKIEAERPDGVVFKGYYGQYTHAPIDVRAGERVRVWVVDAGPKFGTSFHVVGTQFDTAFKEGAYLLRPGNPEYGAAQMLNLA